MKYTVRLKNGKVVTMNSEEFLQHRNLKVKDKSTKKEDNQNIKTDKKIAKATEKRKNKKAKEKN